MKLDSGTLRGLFHRVLSRPTPFVGGISVLLVGTGAALIEPRLFGYAVDEAIIPKNWDLLRMLSVLFFSLICIRVAAVIVQGYLFELLGQGITQDLRCELFDHLQSLPITVFDRNPAGRLLKNVHL